MNKRIDQRLWGVLGKQQTYYSPQKQVQGKTKTPLNANAFDSWDAKRSRFKRVDGFENAIQQGGTVIGQQPVVTSSPVVVTPTPTPSFTPTTTATPTLTPSSTPFPLPLQPDLWYDATNVGSIDYISSGGTDYVSAWRSLGNYNKTLTGATTDTMPVWSGSSLFPGSPNIIRFNKSTTTGLRDFLSQRFDSTVITGQGLTIFTVIAKPSILDYSTATGTLGFGLQTYFFSGNNTTGGFTPVVGQPTRLLNSNIGAGANTIQLQNTFSGITVANPIAFSATNLNDKFLITQAVPFPTGNPYMEINQSGTTLPNTITASPVTDFSSLILGASPTSGGTINASNAGCELGEIMIFTKELTVQQQEAVQNYLRDKWRYDEWASPVPTPTQTASPTVTPTASLTPTQTASPTVTPTPSSTPPPFSPSGITNLQMWYMSDSGATVSSWANYGLLGGSVVQSTAANQPQVLTGQTLGSFTGTAMRFANRDFMTGSTSSTSFSAETIFMVLKRVFATNTGWGVTMYNNVNPTSFTGNYVWYYQSRSIGASQVNANPTLVSMAPVTNVLLSSSGDTTFMSATTNGSFTASTSSTLTGSTNVVRFDIGYDPGFDEGQTHDVFEFIAYNRLLTSTEYNNVTNYLKTKYQYNTW